jgi:polyferredoxin
MLYAGMFSLVGLIMLAGYLNRTILEINVLHDRSPPYVLLSDGSIRNGYTVKILNKLHEPRMVTLSANGLPGARVVIVGGETGDDAPVKIGTDDLRELKVYVTVPATEVKMLQGASTPIALVVRDTGSKTEMTRRSNFQTPTNGAN